MIPQSTWIPLPARKQVTVLFCDVVDYTWRSVTMDPAELANEIRVFQTLCGEVASKYHGHISSYTGDGIMVLFGHPYASEFAPQYAIRAGLEMVEKIKHNNDSAQWQGHPINIRVGIATGLVVVGERAGGHGELIFGEAPNLAARLQSLAEPNTVLVALRTRRLAGSAFKFRNLGEHHVKGFDQPIIAWQLIGEHAFSNSNSTLKRLNQLDQLNQLNSSLEQDQTQTQFVSRQNELQLLQKYHAQSIRGRCRIIHLSGEPGIGKSRLVSVFEKTISKFKFKFKSKAKSNLHTPHQLRITCAQCFGCSPFKPFIDEMYRWLHINDQDSIETKRKNVHNAMRQIGLDGQDEHILSNDLLAIPPLPEQPHLDISAEEKHHRTVVALATMVLRLAKLHSVVLVVEDVHWADPSTLEVLNNLVSRARDQKLFAIFTSRSGFVAPWSSSDLLAEIKLNGLDANESAKLIANLSVSSVVQLSDAVTQALIRKSRGVPLFLEVTSRHLLSQMHNNAIYGEQLRDGVDIGDRDGNRNGNRDGSRNENSYLSVSIPDTLQDSLNARLDQLGQTKAFAQLAATFGSDFCYSMSSKIAAKNGIDADQGMDVLLEAKLISVVKKQAMDREDHYQFCHALFQEVAYASLLKKTRERYHIQIVELLLQGNPKLEHQHPELIAAHYSHTKHINLAVDLWLRAAQLAISRSAINESMVRLDHGLELLDELPDDEKRSRSELALKLTLGVALTARGGYHGTQVMNTYEQAYALAKKVGSDQQTWAALYGLWRCKVTQAKFLQSIRLSVQLNTLSKKSADTKLMMIAYGLKGMSRMVTGRHLSAERFYDKAVRLYDQHREQNANMMLGQDPYVTILGLAAVNKIILNKIPESLAQINRCVEIARATKHPYTIAETLCVAAMYHQIASNYTTVKKFAKETAALAATYNFKGLLAAANIFLAFCRATCCGQVAQLAQTAQIDRLRRSLQEYSDNYGKLLLPYFHGVLAKACVAVQDYKTAMQVVDQAIKMAKRLGEKWAYARLLAIKIDAARKGGLATEAEITQWQKIGLEIAASQHANWLYDSFCSTDAVA